MIATLTTPTAAPGIVPPMRWTVKEFHKLLEQNYFQGRRAILLHGVILEQGPMNSPHAKGLERLIKALKRFPLDNYRERSQSPLVLGRDSDPSPDYAIVEESTPESADGHPTTAVIVFEISDTSLNTDLTEKAELYATAGILDYWVIDVTKRQLHVLRDPAPLPAGLGATAYRNHKTYGPEESVAPLAFPGHAIRVGELIP